MTDENDPTLSASSARPPGKVILNSHTLEAASTLLGLLLEKEVQVVDRENRPLEGLLVKVEHSPNTLHIRTHEGIHRVPLLEIRTFSCDGHSIIFHGLPPCLF